MEGGPREERELAMNLYDQDFVQWTAETARRLRAQGSIAEADIEHVAEEIEDMGKRDQREAINRAVVILVHLLKCRYQPDKRTRSWDGSIVEQRSALEGVFEQSPSLRRYVEEKWSRVCALAIRQAEREVDPQGFFPKIEDCPFTFTQAVDPDFWP